MAGISTSCPLYALLVLLFPGPLLVLLFPISRAPYFSCYSWAFELWGFRLSV